MGSVPAYSHIVVVVMENQNYSEIAGNTAQAPYINSLMAGGANLTNMSSLGHPSQPNYFALYAGSTFGTTDDNQYSEPDPTIDTILQANGLTFQGYVDTTGGGSDFNHDPWVSFPEGYSVQTDFTSFPALFASGNYSSLPSVSFVIPSITNDMHSGTIPGRRLLAPDQSGRLCAMGQGQQLVAHRHLGRKRRLIDPDDQPDSHPSLRGQCHSRQLQYGLQSIQRDQHHHGRLQPDRPQQRRDCADDSSFRHNSCGGSDDLHAGQRQHRCHHRRTGDFRWRLDRRHCHHQHRRDARRHGDRGQQRLVVHADVGAVQRQSHHHRDAGRRGRWQFAVASDTFTVSLAVPAAPTITQPASGSTDTTTTLPVISGGGVTGDTVTINIDGAQAGTATVVNSAWTFTPTTPLINGSHTIAATQAAPGGQNSSAAADTFTVNLSGAGGSTVKTSFSGITDPNDYPPENALAVGPGFVVMAESSDVEWTNLTGGSAVTESLSTLFSSLGASTNSLLDARAVYDSVNQRFVVMAENLGTGVSSIDIAVSKDANPNDGWYVGSFNSELTINGDVTQADMPYLSVDGKNIYVSENQYGTSREGTQETVFGDGIYSGGPLAVVASQVAPASVGNARNVAGANGLTFYVSNAPSGGQDVLTIQNFNNSTNAFSAATTISLGNSDQGASPSDYTVAQEGSSLLLDAYDSRIASLAYWNGYVYGLMEIEPVGTTVPEIEWFKINVSNPAAPTLAAQGISPAPRSAPASGCSTVRWRSMRRAIC